jgi:hypothetical protein
MFVKNGTLSQSDYVQTMAQVRTLRAELFRLAEKKGNLDPEVLALSQVIDRYIVVIQKHWRYENPQVS